MSYGIPAILYALTAPFVYRLCQIIEKRGVVLIGFAIISFSMLLISKNSAYAVFLGLSLLGLSSGLVSIPVLPEMLESVESNDHLREKYDLKGIENLTSGVFILFQGLGEAAGPIVGSFLAETYGFDKS